MNIEERVKMNLLIRGFDNKTLLNDRGLIGATIDETILELVKNLRISDVSGSTNIKIKPIWTDYYLNGFKWYRKWRKCTWYKHQFTNDALDLSISFTGTWWALYGKINRYSDVVDTEVWEYCH